MNENTLVKIIRKVEVTDLAGEKVMIDFESGNYLLIKGTGNDIWDIITEKDCTVGNIVDRLLSEYEVERETCYSEVLKFIQELLNYKMIEIL